ncbi:P-GlycoProtein related [Caenorhabditis elegans]|uniref:p-GlycoProtein related n=2 Tax=Caenorhabditis elegans TaxID=6239 RepID=Q17645_CAEEL|nr:P-GlycoProtein related [Caenorhabditis elegans]CAA94202.2 P-GlycoProtein related [Caenorhabditis elegans]|eukprot:NP_001257116.1 P-GlycoProtein related [Caenorhabditis elegans]
MDSFPLLPFSSNTNWSNVCKFIKVIIKCTTRYEKLLFFLGVVFSILTGMCQPFESYTLGETSQVLVKVTNAINNKTIDPVDLAHAYKLFESDMNRVVLLFFLVGFAYFTFGFLQFSIMKFVGDNTAYNVRRQYISRLLRKDISYFDGMSTGHLSIVLNDNMERFREVFNEKIALIIALLTDFVIGTILAFYTDWRLACYGTVFSFGIVLSGLLDSWGKMKNNEKQNEHISNAGSIAFQALGCYKTVSSLNGQQQEVERYTEELKNGEKYALNRAFVFSLSRSADYFFTNALNFVILYFGANMIYEGTIEPGVVVRILYYILFGSYCLGEAILHISRLASAIPLTVPIADILLDSDATADEFFSEEIKDTFQGIISFKNVLFSYPTRPDVPVLKEISFNVQGGECIALVGASGSGKSTVIQLLLHYYNIDSGRISIDGNDIYNINIKQLRQAMGVVFQEPVLFNTSIEENIRFGKPDATEQEIIDALKNANAFDFVCNFPDGIKTIVGERGAQLSGGQKQRIAIARTLVRNPRILLLDEATSALDNESEFIVQEALQKASIGRTTIVVAHRLSTIRNANKIIVMEKGEIVEVGDHKQLIAMNGVYNNLVQTQLMSTNYEKMNENEERVTRQSSHSDFPSNEISHQKIDQEDDYVKKLIAEIKEEGAKKSNICEIIKYCRSEYCILFIAVLGSAIQGIYYPLSSQLMIKSYEAYAFDKDEMLSKSHFWALSILFLAFTRPIFIFFQYYFFGKTAEKLSIKLRSMSFKHLMSLPCAFYDDPCHTATRLSNRLNADSSNVTAAVDDRLGSVIMTLVAILLAVIMSFFYSWKMSLQVLMFCPLLYLAGYCNDNFVDQAVEEDSIAFEKSNRAAIEALENVRTVRALNMENRVILLVTSHLQKIRNSYFKRAVIQGTANGFACSCYFFIYAVSFKFGTWLVLREEILPMDTYLVLMTLSMTASYAGSAVAYLPDHRKAIHAAGLIFHLFTYPAIMPYDSSQGKRNIKNGEIELKNVSFEYAQRSDKMILDGVSLKLPAGRTLALVGPSGSGKSTIISLLERFYHAVDGEVKIDEENVVDVNLHHLRESVSLVSQEPVLFNCSIKENFLFGISHNASQLEIDQALKVANAFSFVSQFPQGLDTLVGERGAQLSGGQKQRIAIARAILRNPKVLLLDEATSALDSDSEKVVQNALDTASERLSTVVVAHRLSTVVNADSIAVLKNGKVAEQGTHEELLRKRSIYWRLVQKQGIQVETLIE